MTNELEKLEYAVIKITADSNVLIGVSQKVIAECRKCRDAIDEIRRKQEEYG